MSGIPVPDREPAPPTVLIVDDEDILRRIMARTLTDEGYRVLVAGDGAAAWEMVRLAEGDIQAVVTDMVMPAMGGVELAQKIATLAAPPPVVLISGYSQNQQQLDLPFLRKPFRPNELVTMVAQVLAG
jgi:two-component system OmpR family response regulator